VSVVVVFGVGVDIGVEAAVTPTPVAGKVIDINVTLGDKIKLGDLILNIESVAVKTPKEETPVTAASTPISTSPALTRTSITSTSSKSPISGTITGMIFGSVLTTSAIDSSLLAALSSSV
jgi:pyruvate/2-oxoglutarate dehydrogenase complex dihydrolipoamide acyltransferase (E2) component